MSSTLIKPDWPAPATVAALCTTRMGGYSAAPFDSFNLGDHVGDDAAAVAANRRVLLDDCAGLSAISWLQQVHGVVVVEAEAACSPAADAQFTRENGLGCAVMTADCLPVLFCNRDGTQVAAAHAGWRGLSAGVIEQTVHAMYKQAGIASAQVRAWLGPCIGPDAFEVGEDVRMAFANKGDVTQAACYFKPHPTHAQKWLADLAGLARWRLKDLGVSSVAGNDSTPEWCTVAQRSRLFSYRRDGVTGRFAVCIWRN